MKQKNSTGVIGTLIIVILISCIALSGCTELSGSSDTSDTSSNNVEKIVPGDFT